MNFALSLEGARAVFTRVNIVAKKCAAKFRSKCFTQLCYVNQLAVLSSPDVNDDGEPDWVSMVEKDEEQVCVWCPHHSGLVALADCMVEIDDDAGICFFLWWVQLRQLCHLHLRLNRKQYDLVIHLYVRTLLPLIQMKCIVLVKVMIK